MNKVPRKNTSRRNQLRIIGGKWRGRKLQFPDSEGLRPTGDRIRETLFNWLAPDIVDARCLDLFTGSGALALESLSRGAACVVAIDSHPAAIQQLRLTCETLPPAALELHQADALQWLETYRSHNSGRTSFDVVFVDPPFQSQLISPISAAIDRNRLVAPGSLVYVEADRNQTFSVPGNWQIRRHKHSGQIQYTLYEVVDAAAE